MEIALSLARGEQPFLRTRPYRQPVLSWLINLIVQCSLHQRILAAAPPGLIGSTSSPLVVGDGRPSPTDLLWEAGQAYKAGRPLPSLFSQLYASRALHYAPPMLVGPDKGDKDKEKDRIREGSWGDSEWEAGWNAAAGAVWDGLGESTTRCVSSHHWQLTRASLIDREWNAFRIARRDCSRPSDQVGRWMGFKTSRARAQGETGKSDHLSRSQPVLDANG